MKNHVIEYKKVPTEHYDMHNTYECTEWSWKATISQKEYVEHLGDWKEHNDEYITEQVMSDDMAEVKQHASMVCCEIEYNEYSNVCNDI